MAQGYPGGYGPMAAKRAEARRAREIPALPHAARAPVEGTGGNGCCSTASMRFSSLLLALLLPGSAAAQLCEPAGDCVVGSHVVIPGGSTIDLPGRAVVVEASGRIEVTGPDDVSIRARSLRMAPGARIDAPGDSRR